MMAQVKAIIPIEAHAHWRFKRDDLNRDIEVRYVAINEATELETASESITHKVVALRMRSRLLGIPLPPVADEYVLSVDWRWVNETAWRREPQRWPLLIRVISPKPRVTH
jgi:hypothetical protein